MSRLVLSTFLTAVLACQSSVAGLADDDKGPRLVHFAEAPRALKKEIYKAAYESCLMVPKRGLVQLCWLTKSRVHFVGKPSPQPSLKWLEKADLRVFRAGVVRVIGKDIYVMDYRPPVVLKIPGKTDLTQGDTIYCVASDKGTYEYESVGGHRRMKYWENVSKRITPEAWQKALQAGKSYRMELWIDEICPECRGLSKRRGCRRCKGTGKVHEVRECKVVW